MQLKGAIRRSVHGSVVAVAAALALGFLGAAEAAHATCIDYAQFMRTRSTLALAGAPWKVTIGNGMAYVAVGIGGMRIVDYSDPAAPLLLGSVTAIADAREIAVSQRYAYVADAGGSLKVVDITNPQLPMIVGGVTIPGTPYAIAINGSYAYVAAGATGLHVVDIRNPAVPSVVGSLDTVGSARSVALKGAYAYIADGDYGLVIVDITIPSNPVRRGNWNSPARSEGVAVAGAYAYIADNTSGLRVVDVSNPDVPILVASADTPGTAYDVALLDNHAIVADYNYGVHVVDISNSLAPRSEGRIATTGGVVGVEVTGGFVFAADVSLGFMTIAAPTPTPPPVTGIYDSPGYVRGVSVVPPYAYIADAGYLRVVDISDPDSPTLVESANTRGIARDVAYANGYAYVTSAEYGLSVVRLTIPGNPLIVNELDTPGSALAIDMAGDHVYIADGYSGLFIANVANPALPQHVATVPASLYTHDVCVSGGYAYLADAYYLSIVDISTPGSAHVVGQTDLNELVTPTGVDVEGTLAYVAGGVFGLYVVDIADPTDPTLIGSIPLPFEVRNLVVRAGTAYLTDEGGMIQIVDVSHPSAPRLLNEAYIGVAQGPFDATEDGVFVPVGLTGMVVMPIQCEAVAATDGPTGLAAGLVLAAWPNPTTGSIAIRFVSSHGQRVSVDVYDMAGRRVRRLVDAEMGDGGQETWWDGLDDRGRRVASGVYTVTARTPRGAATERVVMIR